CARYSDTDSYYFFDYW
nr:immunoglobulin heavy chain junction region [Macaca mulatta]MOX60147.1 immunoglobulin heavy chain junction region [Macaca mulatta]MOX60849.1 immunoglobulin heavy chain junction region [Macaca mulatta]MOX61531.1 immunoglobulin heavy chain junction region [Macaca mulatta]MOX61945.1 immunoglobulin heavy chain junction region [Macaca mulatta]